MTVDCTTSAEAITSVLLAGDAILNLTDRPLNTMADARFLSISGGRGVVGTVACRCAPEMLTPGVLDQVSAQSIGRLVVVTEPDCLQTAGLMAELQRRQIPAIRCVIADDCGADAFMDEEESEAVAERLRQLGYL